jgi:WD40 repeat protein
MAAFTPLFGPQLEDGEAQVETEVVLADKVAIGIYFAKSTAEACQEFGPKLTSAYNDALQAKNFEVVLVCLDETEEDFGTCFADLPGYALPFACAEQKQALIEKYEVATDSVAPVLIIVDPEGATIEADGVTKVTEDPAGENFPWLDLSLSETEVLVRMGPVPPEAGEDGLKGVFIRNTNFKDLGLVDETERDENIPFSGFNPRPYAFLDKAARQTEIQRMGVMSDWQPYAKDIEKLPYGEILIIFDPERIYGEKFVMPINKSAYDREKARVLEKRQEVLDAHEESLRKDVGGGDGGDGGGGDDEVEENIVVRDEPKVCGDWKSETMEQTHSEVANFTVTSGRPLMQLMITRARAHFGNCKAKLSDSGENLQFCRPQKDPNFSLFRKELEIGVQAVKETKSSSCQTTWFRPVNKSTQYSPADFLKGERHSLGYDQVDALSTFLSSVSVSVEEALQTNETVDIFQEEFSSLGADDAGAVSEATSNMKELRNFHDVTYTRGKRIEWVEWIPNSSEMLACSYCDNLPFAERLEHAGKASVSTILIWSFQDALSPHAILQSPWEVPVFKFYPGNERYVVGGLSSGQFIVWKLSDADLGLAARDRTKSSIEEEKVNTIPVVAHKQISVIDDSHKKAILAIEWLPPNLEIERRGRGASMKDEKDAPHKYFLSTAGDGLVMIWDFTSCIDGLNEFDFIWRPVHRIQLQRQDSGTEMGLGHILYCHDRQDEKGNKQLTNFYATTEEGELIFGDWAARVEEDRKPEYTKKMFAVSKTFRPMLSLERSPFFQDILLGVTDWAFYLWKDGVKDHLFQSSYVASGVTTYFSRGVWSPTRPSVIFLGLQSGGVDIWDFNDQSNKASLTDTGAAAPISSMVFLKHGDLTADQKLAIGDAQGHLHVHSIPKNLVRQVGKEVNSFQKFLEREEQRVAYFEARRLELIEEREKVEKNAQMAQGEEEAVPTTKTAADEEKMDKVAEDTYQRLEAECLEMLKTGTVPG